MKTAIDLKGLNIQELPITYGWSPSNGYHTVRQWKGTQAEIENLLPGLRADGYEYEVKAGPLWSVIAKIEQDTSSGEPAPEVPIPSFEILANKREVDLLDSTNPLLNRITAEQKRIIKDAVSKSDQLSFITSKINAYKNATVDQKQASALISLLYLAGAKTWTVFLPVLRKTYNASNTYIVNDSIDSVNEIFTTTGLISAENVPFMIQGLLPNEVAPSGEIPYKVGWLKGHPTYNQIGRNQFQVNVEYEYNYWASDLYDWA